MKTKQSKTLTKTQINALIERVISDFNAKVKAGVARDEREREMLVKQWKEKLICVVAPEVKMKNAKELAEFIIEQQHHIDDTAWFSQTSMVGKLPEFCGEYDPSGWRRENHPMHKIISDMRFKLVMASVDNYEALLQDVTAEIDKLFK